MQTPAILPAAMQRQLAPKPSMQRWVSGSGFFKVSSIIKGRKFDPKIFDPKIFGSGNFRVENFRVEFPSFDLKGLIGGVKPS